MADERNHQLSEKSGWEILRETTIEGAIGYGVAFAMLFWAPGFLWAVLGIVSVWVFVANALHSAGILTKDEYKRYRASFPKIALALTAIFITYLALFGGW